MKIPKNLKLADYITLLGIVSAIISIILSLQGNIFISAWFIILAVIFDSFDGLVARKTKTVNEFGINLDSLADLVSFGVAPSVFVIMQGLGNLLGYVAVVFFVCASALRLARYNVITTLKKIKYFEGLPTTANGIIFPVLFFLHEIYAFSYYVEIVTALLFISGVLMISSIKIKKL